MSTSVSKPISARFFVLTGLIVLAFCAGYSALVLHSSTWAEARQLDVIFPFYTWRTRLFSVAEFTQLRTGLTAAASATVLLLAIGSGTAYGRKELLMLRTEIAGIWRGLWESWQQLPRTQKMLANGAFLLLTAVRLYFSLANPEYDDAVSYEVFVSKGLLATSAYYPIPNNHVFSNTISWLFYQANPGFWWTMRLPVLLICTAATVFWFVGLVQKAGFRVAMVAVGLFSGLQLSLYHAGVGRGYWLLIGLAGVVFFALLELLAKQARERAAWAALAVAGTLGCYTVPTFVYVLASAFSWLGLTYLRQRNWADMGRAVTMGTLIGIASVLLYAPLLLVSGADKFTGNGFVAPLPPEQFWRGLPAYIWHNEGFLAGQRTLGSLLTIPVLLVVMLLFYAAHRGRLTTIQVQQLHKLGRPALWFMGTPYVLLLVQRVFPPERVLLYKAVFFFLLVGIVVDWALTRWPAPRHRGAWRVMSLGVLLFLSYQAYSVVRVNPVARGTNAAYFAGLRWLATQPTGPVLVPEPTHNLFLRFYAHTQERQRPWQIDYDQQAGQRYAYVVAFPNKRGYFQPEFPFPPAYRNAELEIYAVPATYELHSALWKH
jgi:hypothetical protein